MPFLLPQPTKVQILSEIKEEGEVYQLRDVPPQPNVFFIGRRLLPKIKEMKLAEGNVYGILNK